MLLNTENRPEKYQRGDKLGLLHRRSLLVMAFFCLFEGCCQNKEDRSDRNRRTRKYVGCFCRRRQNYQERTEHSNNSSPVPDRSCERGKDGSQPHACAEEECTSMAKQDLDVTTLQPTEGASGVIKVKIHEEPQDEAKQGDTGVDTKTQDEEYIACLQHVLLVPEEQRVHVLKEYLLNFSSESFRITIQNLKEKEEKHIVLVREAMIRIGYPSQHDWSKDFYYFFITGGKFELKIESELLESEFVRVVREHHRKEPHHPEWESINQESCTEADVIEMAVDRCSRNVWVNHGEINMLQMATFSPRFTFDHKRKLEVYNAYVEKYKDVVIQVYREVISDV